MSRIIRQWSVDVRAATGQFAIWLIIFKAQLETLSPPSECAADHDRLIALAESWPKARRAQDAIRNRVVAVVDINTEVCVFFSRLDRQAAGGDQLEYFTHLRPIVSECRKQSAGVYAQAELATQAALKSLSRLRVPAEASSAHQQMFVAFEAQLSAMRALSEASGTGDSDVSRHVVTEWLGSLAPLSAAALEIADSVNYFDRWPKPTSPGASR